MTATTRSAESTAVSGPTLKLACELGSTKWTLGCSTAPAQRARVRTITAGDLAALEKEMLIAKTRFGLPLDAAVQSCYEAGRDGFWLHRWLIGRGVANVVVESSSIEVNRRARLAKTDRLEVGKLLALLLRWLGGERTVWSVIHIPSAEADAQRQLTREIDTVREDRKRVRNRIQGGLATQGVRLPLTGNFLEQLRTAQTGDGHPLPVAFRTRLEHEWAHLEAIEAPLGALTAARDEHLATGSDRVATVARQLGTLRAVAETSAAVCSAELFGTRTLTNGRPLGALLGLVPVPYRSDQAVRAAPSSGGCGSRSRGAGCAGNRTAP